MNFRPPSVSTEPAPAVDSVAGSPCPPRARPRRQRAMTLVEVIIAMTLLATVMVGFISAFLQSRRFTESSVLHAACTSLVFGLIEQMKGLDYTTLLPSYDVDTDAPDDIEDHPPYIRLRINQDLTVWLRVVHTPYTPTSTPQAPTTTPAPTATAESVGAIDNFVGSIPLSTVTGTTSQELALNLWIWIDEIVGTDVSEVKKITVVYTYSFIDGASTRIVRDREVFLRTRYDQ